MTDITLSVLTLSVLTLSVLTLSVLTLSVLTLSEGETWRSKWTWSGCTSSSTKP